MSAPLVSVIIPCFNSERFIGETLESVLNQSWPNIEIIAVNDGSYDATPAVLSRFPRVKALHQANQGVTVARQTGLANARGGYIQYLDADDILSPDKIGEQMRRLNGVTDCVASAQWGRFYGKDSMQANFISESVWQDLDPLDWLALSRHDGFGMMLPALWLIPRLIIDRTGPWIDSLRYAPGEDAEYFTRVLLNSRRILFCEGARCYYRSNVGGGSSQKSARSWEAQANVIALCQSHVLAKENSERMRRCFALSWQRLAHACHPYDRALGRKALQKAAELHPVKIAPSGGRIFKVLSYTIGWKLARLLQVASGRS